MIHSIAYVLFILPFTYWLGFELKRKHNLRTYWSWIAGAFVVGIIGSQIFRVYPDLLGNFLLHVSGGVSSTLMYIYLIKTLNISFNWRLNLVLLFSFVCMLGVLNELAEYAYELAGLGIMSVDTHDTWRDFVANTTGAYAAWFVYKLTQITL